jgi:hypothetical protein
MSAQSEQKHRNAVRGMLDADEASQGARIGEDTDLGTAVEVLDDIRGLIAMGIELRDQLAVLIRREGPVFLDRLAKNLGKTEDEIIDAVIDARAAAKIDLDKYRLKHHPTVQREMKERFNTDVAPGKEGAV